MNKVLYLNIVFFIMLKCTIWKLSVVMCFKIAWPLHSLTATFHTSSDLFCFFPETEFQTSNFKRPLYWLKGPVYKPLNCNQVNWICMVPWARRFSKKVDFVLIWVSQFCILSLCSLFPIWTPSGNTLSWVYTYSWILHTLPDSAHCTNCWEQVFPWPCSTMPTAGSESLCLGLDLLRRWVTSKTKKIWEVVGT